MPIVIKLGPSGAVVPFAANAGQFAANQELAQLGQGQQRINLEAQNQDLAQQRFDDQQQQGAEQLQYKYDALGALSANRDAKLQQGYDLDEARTIRQTLIQNMRDADAAGRLDERGRQTLERLRQQEDFDTQRDATRFGNRQTLQDDNWDQRWSINDSDQAYRNYRQQRGLDFRDQHPSGGGMGQDARQWSMQDRQWRETAGYLQQQLRRLQIAYEGARRANYGQGDQQAMQSIASEIATLKGQLNAHMTQQPAIPQQPAGNPQSYDPNQPPPNFNDQQSQGDPAAVIGQIAQQIIQEMPTASHAAQKVELQVRAQQMGIA